MQPAGSRPGSRPTFCCARKLDKEALLTQLRLQRALRQHALEEIAASAERIRAAVEHNPAAAKDALLWEAVRRAGERSERLYLDWLDETITLVQDNF